MPRYKPKTRCSKHAKMRVSQRIGDGDADSLSRMAWNHGIRLGQIPEEGPLFEYILSRQNTKDKPVRLYEGHAFVFSKNGRLITAYPISEDVMPYYEDAKWIERRNRRVYRAARRKSVI